MTQLMHNITYYLHQDALGSTMLTMTSTVTPSFKAEYIPYGPSYGVTGGEAFQYTGKLLDSVTGLYYEGARYYDPETGRFITEDSVVGTGDDPQSLNRYVYARDNPMKIVDMAGHEWWNPVADVSAAVSDAAGALGNVQSAVSNEWNSLPPSEQAGIVVGAAAVATVGLCITVIGCFAAPEIDLGAVATVAGVAGAGAVADTAPEITPDASTIATTINSGLLRGALNTVANTLDNPGPEQTDSQAIGQWGQNALRPLMRLLGFTEEQYKFSTAKGNLYADFYNPVTKVAIDAKTGMGSQEVIQAIKYQLAQKAGQISNVYYLNIPNPWTGVNGGDQLANFVTKYGFKLLPLFY